MRLTNPFEDVLFAFGDHHIPFNDIILDRILLSLIEEVSPTILLDGGDAISADQLSTYRKKSFQLTGLQNELDADYAWRKLLAKAAPKAKTKLLLRDNHFIRRLEDVKCDAHWAEDLRSLDPEELLRVNELGWKLVKKWCWRETLLFLHGDDKNPSYQAASGNPVNRARNMMTKARISVVRFHSHTTGIEMHCDYHGDTKFAVQLGTFQDRARINYMVQPELANWTSSAAVFHLMKNRTFFVEPIFFVGQQCVFRGKLYK